MKKGKIVRTSEEFLEAIKDAEPKSVIIWIDGINVTDKQKMRELKRGEIENENI